MKGAKNQQQNNKDQKKSKNNNNKNDSYGKIKKRIRDLKRTIQRGAKTAKAQIESERRLRALEYELGEKYIDEQQEKFYQKYRTVKFLEFKKAQRKVKRATKAIEEAKDVDEEEKKKLQDKLDECRIDELYTTNYPKTLPYISLYEKEKSNIEKNDKLRNALREKIKQILDRDGDMSELAKEYREQYREKMVKLERIPAVRPLNDQEDQSAPEQHQTITEKDDFFA
ncbi:hypothetical protein BDA99DRAFT_519478 [Phascolomyces articulosus]|uniref:rRNA-processing protein EFG1 n=1 Tax=Phascolomyces articulosus TaxID=60185 RepID=A0AAD5PAN7_9FUNG|nr:hypothetical protein BDA99DRAFT_519478 [Phascolomyces articulosus]